jgi:hypothetical protein
LEAWDESALKTRYGTGNSFLFWRDMPAAREGDRPKQHFLVAYYKNHGLCYADDVTSDDLISLKANLKINLQKYIYK